MVVIHERLLQIVFLQNLFGETLVCLKHTGARAPNDIFTPPHCSSVILKYYSEKDNKQYRDACKKAS